LREFLNSITALNPTINTFEISNTCSTTVKAPSKSASAFTMILPKGLIEPDVDFNLSPGIICYAYIRDLTGLAIDYETVLLRVAGCCG